MRLVLDDIDRPELHDLLASLNGTRKIIVMNTSRLWRNDTAKVIIRRELKKAESDVVSIEQPNYSVYSTDTNDSLMNSMYELLDQYEKMSIALKLARGRKTKAEKGEKACGVAPLGYMWSGKQIIVDEKAAETVKLIFKKYLELQNLNALKRFLDGKEIKTSNGNDFSVQSLKNMLSNDFYKGVLRHGEIEQQGAHEEIINKITFGKVQSVLKKQSRG